MERNRVTEQDKHHDYENEAKKPVRSSHDNSGTTETIRLYKRRWLMLAIFCLFSLSNAYQWIHLGIIGNIVVNYYNASLPNDRLRQDTLIDWLSLSYLAVYVPCIFPAMWLLDRKGLKVNNVVGNLLNVVGVWLKCCSLASDRFVVLLIGQLINAVAEVFVVNIPPRLAAVWFGPREVSTATSIGVFGNQVGIAVGFLVPPLLVPNSPHLDDVGHGLTIMYYGGAIICTIFFFLMLIVYQNEPPLPPSRAQLLAKQVVVKNRYMLSLKRLMTNPGFILITISYGINTGAFYAISILLNPMVLFYFQGQEQSVGMIGLTIIITGIIGAILAGIWLDKTQTFKSTSTAIYFLSWLGMLAHTVILYSNLGRIWVIFLTAGFLGFFMTGYLPVGYEFAAEITYPEPEGTSSGILTASAMFFGIVLTLGMRAMMNGVSILAANTFLTIALFIGGIMTALVKPEYKRQNAEKEVIKHLNELHIISETDEKQGNTNA